MCVCIIVYIYIHSIYACIDICGIPVHVIITIIFANSRFVVGVIPNTLGFFLLFGPNTRGFLFAKAIAGSPVNITMTVLSQSEIRVSQGHRDLADDLGRGDMGLIKIHDSVVVSIIC